MGTDFSTRLLFENSKTTIDQALERLSSYLTSESRAELLAELPWKAERQNTCYRFGALHLDPEFLFPADDSLTKFCREKVDEGRVCWCLDKQVMLPFNFVYIRSGEKFTEVTFNIVRWARHLLLDRSNSIIPTWIQIAKDTRSTAAYLDFEDDLLHLIYPISHDIAGFDETVPGFHPTSNYDVVFQDFLKRAAIEVATGRLGV